MRVVFLNFRGSCAYKSPNPAAPQLDRMELGETSSSAGVVLPYSEMNCDRLRAFIADRQPTRNGIAKAVYTPAALLGASLRFEAGELERIRKKYALQPSTLSVRKPLRRRLSPPTETFSAPVRKPYCQAVRSWRR
jgi:hypothetical protein